MCSGCPHNSSIKADSVFSHSGVGAIAAGAAMAASLFWGANVTEWSSFYHMVVKRLCASHCIMLALH